VIEPHRTALAIALAVLLLPIPSSAFTTLTAGKTLKTVDKSSPRSDKAVFSWKSEPALITVPERPLCPTVSKLRLVTNAATLPEIELDCARWLFTGSGFRYLDRSPNGSIGIKLGIGKLGVTLKGAPYSAGPVVGPVTFVETRFTIGGTEYCGRWTEPPGDVTQNRPDKVKIKGPTGACQVVCGNSITEDGEECDDGDLVSGDGCDANCTVTACGNGIQTPPEGCDDGDTESGDGCRADCTPEVCGDGIEDASEACDDGNVAAGDCCSPTCSFETSGSPCAGDGNLCTDDTCDGAGFCQHPANTAPCNDLDGCTIDDTCSGGVCGGALRAPWINEIDYDDFFAVLDDRDEFVEIAGPAGTDLSGFQILNVEGGPTSCLTPHYAPQVAPGEAHMLVTIPPGTVLGDDTGTGIGFYVACFTSSSINVVNLPACDDVLAAPRLDSNLLNGHLLNTDETTCPDGVLLLDPDDEYVDAVSYEGVIPSVGAYGPYFHVSPPYSAPRDEGWLDGVSIEKTTSTLERAQDASEWIDPSETAGCVAQGAGPTPPPACSMLLWTPGAENSQQALECGSPCRAFLDRTANLLE